MKQRVNFLDGNFFFNFQVTTAKKQSKPSKKSSTNKNTTADNSLPVDNDTAATDVAERADNPDQPPLKIKIRQLRNPQPKQSRKLRQSRVEWDEPSKLGRPKSNKMYKCTECDYTSQKRTRWTEHMGRVHGLLTEKDLERQKKSQFPCDTCDKSFIFEKDLKRHKKIVHTTVSHFCGICQKSYKSKYVYDKHVATHKEGYIRNMFICQICKREFTTKFSLANHIKTAHLGIQKTYLCPTCGKSFNQIRSYRQHANVHAGIKPYVCEICGKGFTYDSSLKDHRYMHDNIRRFSCNKCGKAFRQRTSLQIHLKVHKETKDHICSSCGKGFTQKQSLIRHERIHTGDKPYTCMMCQKTFSDYAVIRRHMMMSHKKDKDEWNQFIISDVKRKSDHYIPGGPGYQSRSRNANNKSYVKAVDANVIIPREDAPPPGTGIDLTPLDQHAPAEPETSATTPQPVVTQNEETVYRKKEVIEQPLPTMDGRIQNMFGGGTIYGTATILPQQQLIMTSGTKMVPNTSDHHQLTAVPINYSIPPGCVAAIPSTSPESQIDDSIVNSFLKNDGYRQVRPQQQKDMFTPVLAPLSAVAPVSDTQRTAVPFSTTPVTTEAILSQAAGLAPWGYAGFPAYLNNFNPANFAQFQGHQN